MGKNEVVTSIDELDHCILQAKEDETLEFKTASNQYDTDKLMRYCVAIANEGGGKFILGVSDKPPRAVVGSLAFKNTEEIQRRILNTLKFRVDVEEVMHPNGRVIIFHIPTRPKGTAYHFKGAYLMRSTEDTLPMSEDRLRQIFSEGKKSWLLLNAKTNCDDVEVVRLLDVQAYFDMMHLPLPSDRKGMLDRFSKESFIRKIKEHWSISHLGALLFAKNFEDFDGLLRKRVRVIVYKSKSKLETQRDHIDSKGYATGFDSLIKLIQSQTPQNEIIETAIREEVKMYPKIAIRELVANALVHQDFTEAGSSVVIEIYSDRIEISNPGKPLIEVDRFIDDYKSRNEKLADIMRRLGICEEKSSGIDKVVNAAEVYQLPAPDFRVGAHRTTVVLFAHINIDDLSRKDRIRGCYQHCCLRYVMNERMSNKSLRERFKLSEKKVALISRVIADTLDAGMIKLDDPENTSRRHAICNDLTHLYSLPLHSFPF